MSAGALEGHRILVVEDEYFLADELQRELTRAGAQVIGPVGAVEEALELLDGTQVPDYAILDLNLNGENALPIGRRLKQMQVGFAFVTGYGSGSVPDDLSEVTRLDKPVDISTVVRSVQTYFAR